MQPGKRLPYMPVWVTDLMDATELWDSDARCLYFWLLMAQWKSRGILPKEAWALKRMAKLESWGKARFDRAWDVIQAVGDPLKEPKFVEDRFGLFNARGRAILLDSWESLVLGQKGALKQHGCSSCRAKKQPVTLANEGWVRYCPQCGVDLWAEYSQAELPWREGMIPPKSEDPSGGAPPPGPPPEAPPGDPPADNGGGPPGTKQSQSHRQGMTIEVYCGEVEGCFQRLVPGAGARTLNPGEGRLAMQWHEHGVPLWLVLEAIGKAAERPRVRNHMAYAGTVIENRLEEQKQLDAASASGPVPGNGSAPVPIDSGTWDIIRSHLVSKLADDDFATWVEPCFATEDGDGKLVVSCPNANFVHTLERWRRLVAEVAGDVEVTFTSPT